MWSDCKGPADSGSPLLRAGSHPAQPESRERRPDRGAERGSAFAARGTVPSSLLLRLHRLQVFIRGFKKVAPRCAEGTTQVGTDGD